MKSTHKQLVQPFPQWSRHSVDTRRRATAPLIFVYLTKKICFVRGVDTRRRATAPLFCLFNKKDFLLVGEIKFYWSRHLVI